MATKVNPVKEAVALESLGEVPGYRSLKLGPKFARAVLDRVEVGDQIKELEEKKRGLSDYLLEEVAQTGLQKVGVDDFVVQIVDTDRMSLSKEKLLEAGVPASTIEACMVASHSTYVRIDDAAKGRVRGQEKRGGVKPIRGRG